MERVKKEIQTIVEEAVAKASADGKILDIEQAPQVKIEYPKEEKYGDYSTPFALETAKVYRKAPFLTAEILKPYIEASPIIDQVEVVKPGFINMFVSKEYIARYLDYALEAGLKYGRSSKETPEKYNIEFVSANPTGPLNVVSARAAALGDSLANLLEASGDIVDREFYVNDYGNQVRLLGKSLYARYLQECGEEVEFPEDGYQGEYLKDIAAKMIEEGAFDKDAYKSEDELLAFFSTYAVTHNLSKQKNVMDSYQVTYKNWFRESSLHESGTVEKIYDEIYKRGVIYDDEGKKVFRSTEYGDDKDRVVVRDDGRPTYLMADIAYHEDKFLRGYDTVIDIWGPDHHGYIARLKGAIEALGHDPEKFTVLIAQQVNLIMDGEPVKMSKRLGRFSTMQDLIDDIGVDAARYFFVMRSMDSHLDFDLDLAKRQSSENPVFYLQYAHARIASIFREADKRNISVEESSLDHSHIDTNESLALAKWIVRFPEEVIDAAQTREVHRMATYLMRLAQSFHKFYAANRVLSDEKARTTSMLAICRAVKLTLKNGLALLGVSAPETM